MVKRNFLKIIGFAFLYRKDNSLSNCKTRELLVEELALPVEPSETRTLLIRFSNGALSKYRLEPGTYSVKTNVNSEVLPERILYCSISVFDLTEKRWLKNLLGLNEPFPTDSVVCNTSIKELMKRFYPDTILKL